MLTSEISNRSNIEEGFANAWTFSFVTVLEHDDRERGLEAWGRHGRYNEECGLGVLAVFCCKPFVECLDRGLEMISSINKHSRVNWIGVIVCPVCKLGYNAKIASSPCVRETKEMRSDPYIFKLRRSTVFGARSGRWRFQRRFI